MYDCVLSCWPEAAGEVQQAAAAARRATPMTRVVAAEEEKEEAEEEEERPGVARVVETGRWRRKT